MGVTSRPNDTGLFVSLGNSVVHATGCTFTENNFFGVDVDGAAGNDPSVTISGSSIHSNLGDYDYRTRSFGEPDETIVWAPDCWWGTADEEQIRERIFDHEDNASRPRVYFRPFGESCDTAIGRDQDGDGVGDFEDNCPKHENTDQADSDGDLMGDACDPEVDTVPSGDCDGSNDVNEGYVDSDNDNWGDPCDFQPTRTDSHPDALELCDGRDNDGDALLAVGELIDGDFDEGIECGDCDDFEPEVHVCACEDCSNLRDDDCDGLIDGSDSDCDERPNCVVLTSAVNGPLLIVEKGNCGGASISGPFDVIRGDLGQIRIVDGSVDLGRVACVAENLTWDRVTDLSADPNPACDKVPALFYLGRDTGDLDFGSASSGQPRDEMSPNPPCP
jgi:hypothetical protein